MVTHSAQVADGATRVVRMSDGRVLNGGPVAADDGDSE
jgi:ABC-type lipoprotein export system ATPase subunit